jgi:hypothetical protein
VPKLFLFIFKFLIFPDPSGDSFFYATDCLKTTQNTPKTQCEDGCYFGTVALKNQEYAVVRGCVEDFASADQRDQHTSCELGRSENSIQIDGKIVQKVGFELLELVKVGIWFFLDSEN